MREELGRPQDKLCLSRLSQYGKGFMSLDSELPAVADHTSSETTARSPPTQVRASHLPFLSAWQNDLLWGDSTGTGVSTSNAAFRSLSIASGRASELRGICPTQLTVSICFGQSALRAGTRMLCFIKNVFVSGNMFTASGPETLRMTVPQVLPMWRSISEADRFHNPTVNQRCSYTPISLRLIKSHRRQWVTLPRKVQMQTLRVCMRLPILETPTVTIEYRTLTHSA